jgi:hypothetical protein
MRSGSGATRFCGTILVGALLASGGCDPGRAGAGTDGVADDQQALQAWWTWSWGTPGNAGPDLDLGPTSDRTCFLTGVGGSLKSSLDPAGSLKAPVSAGVYQIDGHWKIQTRAGLGPGVDVQVACIPFTQHRVEMGVSEGHPIGIQPYVPATPGRQCFLTSVYSFGYPGGWAGDLWNGPPGVSVAKEGPNWVLRDFLLENASGDPSGSASAVCVDVPDVSNPIHYQTGSAPFSSKVFQNTKGDEWICGLTSLFGAFDSDWSQPGAGLWLDSSHNWNVSMAADRSFDAICVK